MQRRQFISDELRYSHQTSPRKVATFGGAPSPQPSILYINNVKTDPKSNWIGKILVPWNGENIESYKRAIQTGTNNPKYVSEFEIANFCRPYIYRIVYVEIDKNNNLFMKSKPSIEYVPSRLNVLLTPDNIIRSIAYF